MGSVAPAERRPAGPARRDRRERRGKESDQDRKEKEKRERRGLPSEERKRKAQERKPTKPSFNAEVATGGGSGGGGAPLFSASATWLPTPWPPVAPGAVAVHRCQ